VELTLRPDEAQLLASIGVSWIEREWETTRKVISAIPLNRMEYRPDPKARNAMELAWHLACSEAWFLEGILRGEFDKIRQHRLGRRPACGEENETECQCERFQKP
jgi:hypothetical protein